MTSWLRRASKDSSCQAIRRDDFEHENLRIRRETESILSDSTSWQHLLRSFFFWSTSSHMKPCWVQTRLGTKRLSRKHFAAFFGRFSLFPRPFVCIERFKVIQTGLHPLLISAPFHAGLQALDPKWHPSFSLCMFWLLSCSKVNRLSWRKQWSLGSAFLVSAFYKKEHNLGCRFWVLPVKMGDLHFVWQERQQDSSRQSWSMHHDTSIHIMTLTVTNTMTRSLTFHGAVFFLCRELPGDEEDTFRSKSVWVFYMFVYIYICLLIVDIRLSHFLRSVLEFDLILWFMLDSFQNCCRKVLQVWLGCLHGTCLTCHGTVVARPEIFATFEASDLHCFHVDSHLPVFECSDEFDVLIWTFCNLPTLDL